MKKRGKRIKHHIAALPNGFRRDNVWELPIRAAILAAQTVGKLNDDQLYDLWVLGEMTKLTGGKGHLLTHADTLQRLAFSAYNKGGTISQLDRASIQASAEVLLEYIKGVKNMDIMRASLKGQKVLNG